MPTDYRQKTFKAKFTSASKHLGVDPDQVISLKLRDMVASYSEYQELLHVLEQEVGIHWSEVDGNLQGKGYLVDHDDQKVIVVEHETGLELLYIAGSIASLIGLIPLVIQAWGSVRGYLDRITPTISGVSKSASSIRRASSAKTTHVASQAHRPFRSACSTQPYHRQHGFLMQMFMLCGKKSAVSADASRRSRRNLSPRRRPRNGRALTRQMHDICRYAPKS